MGKRLFGLLMLLLSTTLLLSATGCSNTSEKVFTIVVDGEVGEQFRGSVTINKSDGSSVSKTISGTFQKGTISYAIYQEPAKSVSATFHRKNKTENTMTVYLVDKEDKIIETASTSAPFGMVSVSSKK